MSQSTTSSPAGALPAGALGTHLLAWFDRAGRKHLPWQAHPSPYRVWVSEIMLQQTQVGIVIPYYLRFMERFPDVHGLATAALDEVLHLWTGLGYYARARNLHRAACLICERHRGELPHGIDLLMQLPGIGRSTAGAILALAHNARHAILDGNVRRVLARVHAIEGWPGAPAVEKKLWALAQAHLPTARLRDYTQALMDLGATVCTRSRPACSCCPLRPHCIAHAQLRTSDYPAPKPRAALPVRNTTLLMLRNHTGAVLLVQRPPAGVWGGLWSLPECTLRGGPGIQRWCRHTLGLVAGRVECWPALRHTFSHFHLDILPALAEIATHSPTVTEQVPSVWYNINQPDARGLAAPVKRLLLKLAQQSPARNAHDTNDQLRKTGSRSRRPEAATVPG
ncbi:MAG: A/G-specific adenine glycosylase [Gammaproteobacteria bacterium]|nr:A/G-specific adenine glycosylase [Gammaproteobacteria bacterium]